MEQIQRKAREMFRLIFSRVRTEPDHVLHSLSRISKVKRTYCNDFFMNDICFYLDGVSFYHKYNPLDNARAPKGKIWRKRKEGLSVTAKGTHVGSGGRVVKMIVAISYGKGVIYCEQYEKLDGNYYAGFIRRYFQDMF